MKTPKMIVRKFHLYLWQKLLELVILKKRSAKFIVCELYAIAERHRIHSKWKSVHHYPSEDFLWNCGSQDTVTLSNETCPVTEQSPLALRGSPAGEVHKWCHEMRYLHEKLNKEISTPLSIPCKSYFNMYCWLQMKVRTVKHLRATQESVALAAWGQRCARKST